VRKYIISDEGAVCIGLISIVCCFTLSLLLVYIKHEVHQFFSFFPNCPRYGLLDRAAGHFQPPGKKEATPHPAKGNAGGAGSKSQGGATAVAAPSGVRNSIERER
jgi:hypothetical protein